MFRHIHIDGATFDYLIARSGILGRQVLRICRRISRSDIRNSPPPPGAKQGRSRRQALSMLPATGVISRGVVVFYTYYFGGSLTRSDQITFGRLLGMNDTAYRITLYNALFCGIPCAMGYFLMGEGFSLLKNIHSYAQLPSLMAQHTSLAIGTISLSVDIFRAVDAAWHRRCWAPFGFLPLIINTPTYLKRLFQSRRVYTGSRPEKSVESVLSTGCADSMPAGITRITPAVPMNHPANPIPEDGSGYARVISPSR